ncbi:MAG: tryptophan--tRNA ligase [Candidatus Margulisiibacteriota bacterium]|jgi:tryptophanyl-tRNA synthetase
MKKRLMSGIQPTGKMHLGNYFGAITNWVNLQHDYESYFVIVDLHSLTTIYEDPSQLRKNKLDLALDLIAAGIDPEQSYLFFQSDVPEHSELHLLLSMITPLPWLTRVPTYKGKIKELKEKNLDTYGFLGYPVLQTADIILYKAEVVPIGEDQLPHLELAREIVRRFNSIYKTNYFPEPAAKMTKAAVLPGLDGRKMSKSYNNTIPLTGSSEEITKLVLRMFTDPNRKFKTDPGNPDICPVFEYHKLLANPDRFEIAANCRKASIGCVDCKKKCAQEITKITEPIYQKRKELENNLDYVKNVLQENALKVREKTTKTITEIKNLVGL